MLAGATFAAVRSANRSARATERALLAGIRPLLVPSRLGDAPEKVGFVDGHWLKVEGGRAVAEVTDDAIYLAIAIRNSGSGVAVLDRWDFRSDEQTAASTYRDPIRFQRLSRDIYISGGDGGFWQGAFRDPQAPAFAEARAAIESRQRITIDLLYGDLEGGQRSISRFGLIPGPDDSWIAVVSRHWSLDRDEPR